MNQRHVRDVELMLHVPVLRVRVKTIQAYDPDSMLEMI